jgi:hypothetical protein
VAVPGFPVFAKTWLTPSVTVLPLQASATLQNAAGIIACKNALKALTNPVTVIGSSNAVSFNMSGTDTWATTADIVAATSGNISWIVLQHPSGLHICISFNQANNQSATIVYSQVGFTGGSLTARPTATDEFGLGSAETWFLGNNVGRCRLLVLHSTDGKTTYLFILYHGIILSMWMLGEAQPTHGSWSPALVAVINGSNSLNSTNLNDGQRWKANDRVSSYMASGHAFLRTLRPYGGGVVGELSNMDQKALYRESMTGKWPHWTIGLTCINSPRRAPKHGNLTDLWRVPTGIPAGWIMHSDDGSLATMVVGIGYAIPWSPSLQPPVL